MIHVYVDGACLRNPGPGGWAVLIQTERSEKILSGGEAMTTNNRMELMAAIEGLHALDEKEPAILYTDSQYVQQGITLWIHAWWKRGWLTTQGDPVKNKDLWEQLWLNQQRVKPQWQWVKGHAGHPQNERVDALAKAQARFWNGNPDLNQNLFPV